MSDAARAVADAGVPALVGLFRLRYQEAFDFALDARLITDAQGVIAEANFAAAALLACRKEFLVGKPLGFFLAGDGRGRFYQSLILLVRGGGTDEFDGRIGRRDATRDVRLRVNAVDREVSGKSGFCWSLQDITEHRRSGAARVELLHRLVAAQEDERRRVARELHDSVGQLLSALTLAVRSVRDGEPLTASTLTRLEDVQRVADELGRTMHALAVRLRPTALDDFGLKVALQSLIDDWSDRTGVDAHFQAVGLELIRLAPEVETALYRLVQEALTNITKHARARLVSVVVERRDGDAVAVIEDDGVGFDPDEVARAGRLGLLGMQERITLVGGQLQIEAAPRAGTLIRACIPIHHDPPPP